MEYILGWKKDKFDSRDKYHLTRFKEVPTTFSLGQYLPTVRNQGQQGACTGFGIGGNLTGTFIQLGIFTEWASPRWIYNGARLLEGTLNIDAGAEPGDCYKWLYDNGYLLERFWKYIDHPLDTNPPSALQYNDAIKDSGFAYYRCIDGVDGIISALADSHFVSIGTPWPSPWLSNPGKNPLPDITNNTQLCGGHETFLYGYDKNKALFYGQNSWGSEWGDNGLFTMPFEAFNVFKKYFGGYDAQYLTLNISPKPEPTPTPTPKPTPSTCKWGNGFATILNGIQEIRGRRGRFFYKNP